VPMVQRRTWAGRSVMQVEEGRAFDVMLERAVVRASPAP